MDLLLFLVFVAAIFAYLNLTNQRDTLARREQIAVDALVSITNAPDDEPAHLLRSRSGDALRILNRLPRAGAHPLP